MPLITTENLCLGYDKTIVAKNLNFFVEHGDYLSIVGNNGSGKTTLLQTLAGLQKPLSGKIMFSPEIKKTAIGYMAQKSFHQKNFPASVWEVVLSGRLNKVQLFSYFSRDDKKIAEAQLEKLGILSLKKKSYQELSGGQQQRVLLARALCAAKKLLLLDEPAAGLDPQTTDELYKIIKSINENGISMQDNITIIMISHDIPSVLKYSAHLLELDNEQVFFGTPKDYALQNNIPYTQEGQL